jgi:hypothetical protein
MSKNGFEASVFSASHDRTQDSQLAADQWENMYADARNRSLGKADPDANAVFDVLKMVPTTFAAFAGNARNSSALDMGYSQSTFSPTQKTLGGLAVMFGANYAIDRMFFDDQPARGGSMLFDFVAPAAIMFTPLAMRYKVGAGIVSHVIGKSIDKWAP